jgi:hypothetical protein
MLSECQQSLHHCSVYELLLNCAALTQQWQQILILWLCINRYTEVYHSNHRKGRLCCSGQWLCERVHCHFEAVFCCVQGARWCVATKASANACMQAYDSTARATTLSSNALLVYASWCSVVLGAVLYATVFKFKTMCLRKCALSAVNT